MRRLGTVVSKNGKRYVELDKHEACKGCGACNGSRSLLIPDKYEEGTRVEVDASDKNTLPAAALAFLLPFCGMLLGLFVGNRIAEVFAGKAEFIMAISGLCGALAAYVVLRAVKEPITRRFRVEITEVSVYEDDTAKYSHD